MEEITQKVKNWLKPNNPKIFLTVFLVLLAVVMPVILAVYSSQPRLPVIGYIAPMPIMLGILEHSTPRIDELTLVTFTTNTVFWYIVSALSIEGYERWLN